MADDPSPRRFVVRAALLLLPVVVAALLIPRLYRAGSPPRPAPAAASGAPGEAAPSATTAPPPPAPAAGPLGALASGLGAVTGGAPAATAEPGDPAAAPPRRDGPTVEQIEAARAAEEALAQARQGWRKVEFMAPREGKAVAAGERVVPFEGFGLSVDSTPSGAAVTVNGKALGVTPALTSIPCTPGDAIAVEVRHPQLGTRTRQVRCRADQLVSITIPLGR